MDARHILRVLRRFYPHSTRAMVLIGALSFIGGLAEAGILVMITAAAVATSQGDDAVRVLGLQVEAHELLFLALLALALSLALSVLLARAIATTSAKASLNARQQLLVAFHRASYQRKSQDRIATLQEALTTYVDRFTMSFLALSTLLAAMLNLTGFAIAALLVSPLAAIALALIGVILLLVLRPATGRTRRATRRLTTQQRAYAEGATESVLMVREFSVFGVSYAAGTRLRSLDVDVAEQFQRTRFLTLITPRLYQALALGFAVLGLLLLKTVDVNDLAAIGAVVLLLVRSLSYSQQVLTGLQGLAEFRPYVDHLLSLLAAYESEPRTVGTTKIGRLSQITLSKVSFGYGSGPPALGQVTLSIAAGETIGVVGPSGAGKTTLVNLVLRLYRPTTGEILVNQVPLHEVDDDEWHRRAAIVSQEPRLIHGTIADNIRFFRAMDRQRIEHAAESANIGDFVRNLPEGLDSPVGELGMGLSGGQRQRIAIARALAGQPDLLVLDEPTSALDGESEAAIQHTLDHLKGRVTMIVVAHRLSTLTICDRLIVLQDGTVARMGTPGELRDSSTYYRDVLRIAGL